MADMYKAGPSSVAIECLSSIQYKDVAESVAIIHYCYYRYPSNAILLMVFPKSRDNSGMDGRTIQSVRNILTLLRVAERPHYRNRTLVGYHPQHMYVRGEARWVTSMIPSKTAFCWAMAASSSVL